MKFFKLALVALALVASVAVVGCTKEPAPAADGAVTPPTTEAPVEAPK